MPVKAAIESMVSQGLRIDPQAGQTVFYAAYWFFMSACLHAILCTP
jgi:hypothetical protein